MFDENGFGPTVYKFQDEIPGESMNLVERICPDLYAMMANFDQIAGMDTNKNILSIVEKIKDILDEGETVSSAVAGRVLKSIKDAMADPEYGLTAEQSAGINGAIETIWRSDGEYATKMFFAIQKDGGFQSFLDTGPKTDQQQPITPPTSSSQPTTPETGEKTNGFAVNSFVWSQRDDGRDYRFLNDKQEGSENLGDIERIIDHLGFALSQKTSIEEGWFWFSCQEQTYCCHSMWGKSGKTGRSKLIVQIMGVSTEELSRSGISQADMTQSTFWKDPVVLSTPSKDDLSPSMDNISFGKLQSQNTQEHPIAALDAKTKADNLPITDNAAVMIPDRRDETPTARISFDRAKVYLVDQAKASGIAFKTVI